MKIKEKDMFKILKKKKLVNAYAWDDFLNFSILPYTFMKSSA